LNNSNEVFLKNALGGELFDLEYLDVNIEIKDQMLSILEKGTKTELILNVLTYADFAKWGKDDIRRFIDWVAAISDTNADIKDNVLYKCYNPMLVVCLCGEFLGKIAEARSLFGYECGSITGDLVDALGA